MLKKTLKFIFKSQNTSKTVRIDEELTQLI